MAKSHSLIIFFLFLIPLISAAGRGDDAFAEELAPKKDWRQSLGVGKEKVTKLHFYFHDTLSGNNPTAVKIAEAAMTDKSPTLFGEVMMVDDPLTTGPNVTSKEVGRAQGVYGSSGQQGLSLLMVMNFCFTQGKYNGSSISMLSRNPAMTPVRELAIVGGSGLFRLARGFAMAKTYSFDITTGDAIVEYLVTVVHY